MTYSIPVKANYVPSLDGLRAIAVFLVIFRHWHLRYLNLEFGWIGVNFFFVLSGFLITSILVEQKSSTFGSYIKTFYWKRLLRIFPLYYFYILLLFLFIWWYSSELNPGIRVDSFDVLASEFWSNLILLLTYTYNFHNFFSYLSGVEGAATKFLGHLWSLAIEEQFYLFFPFLVYFLDRRKLKMALVSIVVMSPILRMIGGEYLKTMGNGNPFEVGLIIYKTTCFQLDALSIGGLLAIVGWKNISFSSNWLWFTIIAVLILNLLSVYFLKLNGARVSWSSFGFDLAGNQLRYKTGLTILDLKYGITFSLVNIIGVSLLILCLRENLFSTILSSRPFVWVGRISYGIYIYHNPLFVLFIFFIELLGIGRNNSLPSEVFLFLLYITLVLLVASLSFRFIESPFLRLKEQRKISRMAQ